MLTNWIKIAFFNYKKNSLSTFINVLGLSLGLTGFLLISLHWNDENTYEAWNPKKDEIYIFQSHYKLDNIYGSGISIPFAETAKEKIPEIEDFFLLNASGIGYKMSSSHNTIYQENGMWVSKDFFNLMPFKLISGSYQNALIDQHSINISTNVAQKLFGKTAVAGESITIENQQYIIQSVYELPQGNSQLKPEFVQLAYESLKNDKDQWGNFNYSGFFLFKKGTNPDVINEKFKQYVLQKRYEIGAKQSGVSKLEYEEKYGPNSVEFLALSDLKLYAKASWFGKSDLKIILILTVLSLLILILSAINFINLKTAQASQRAKEVGIRKALGSTRKSLILQFLIETLILALGAFIISLVSVELLLPTLNQFLGKELHINRIMPILYTIGMLLILSLCSGIIPAIYLSNFQAIETLKGNFARSKHGVWLRHIILTLQLSISSFFIIGGFIVHSQVNYMLNRDLGFRGEQVLLIQFMERVSQPWLKYERLKTELSKIEGVEAISYNEATPGYGGWSDSNFDFKNESIQARHGSMDFNYLQFMSIDLKKGRYLDPKLASDTINSLIVNEAFVRKIGMTNEEALKNEFQPGFDDKKYRIVGIVKDFHTNGLENKVFPMAFFHYKETEWKRNYMRNILIKINPSDIDGSLRRLQNYWLANVEPGYPFTAYFIDKKFNENFEKYQKQKTLFNLLNIMVLTVALLGLLALSALIIEQKLKSIVLRKMLGASTWSLIVTLNKQFLTITAIAVFISIPISYYLMDEWLTDFAYRIEMPIWPYIISLIILLVLSFSVVSIKAYQATKTSLITYLKYE